MLSMKRPYRQLMQEEEKMLNLPCDAMETSSEWDFNGILNDSLVNSDLTELLYGNPHLIESELNSLNSLLSDTDFTYLEGIKQEPRSPSLISSNQSLNEIEFGCVPNYSPTEHFDPDSLMSPTEVDSAMLSNFISSASSSCSFDSSTDERQSSSHGTLCNDKPQDCIIRNLNEFNVYKKFKPIKPKVEKQDSPTQEETTSCVLNQFSFSINQNSNEAAKLNIPVKSPFDVKHRVLKRQQKMARNRESALHSRKKKKELMLTLEERVDALANCNNQLKFENGTLRDKIKGLETENWVLKNKKLIDVPEVAKKTSYALVIFVFLAINSKSLGLLSSKPSTDLYKTPARHGRFLLEFNKNDVPDSTAVHHNTDYERQMSFPHPKTVMSSVTERKSAKKAGIVNKFDISNKRYMMQRRGKAVDKNETAALTDDTDCPTHFNKTEVVRLNEALERLVKVHQKTNNQKKKNNSSDKLKIKNLRSLKHFRKQSSNCSKNFDSANCSRDEKKEGAKRLEEKKQSLMKQFIKWNEIQIFQEDWNALNMIQKSIDRKPDTFYFISLKKDHIILPATQINDTQRPRFSFIFPISNHSNWNYTQDRIAMVQIDCQVMDTRILHISKQSDVSSLVNRRRS